MAGLFTSLAFLTPFACRSDTGKEAALAQNGVIKETDTLHAVYGRSVRVWTSFLRLPVSFDLGQLSEREDESR